MLHTLATIRQNFENSGVEVGTGEHYVIGVNEAEINEGTYDNLEDAYTEVVRLAEFTEDYFLIDIEARDEDGELLNVQTAYEGNNFGE